MPRLGLEVVEILLHAQALALQYLHNRRDLPHVGDGRFFEGHAVGWGAVVVHLDFGFYSRTGIGELGPAKSR